MRSFAWPPVAALLFLFAAVWAIPQALAVEPSEMLADPVLESRAREISAGLRCLVCQNQSIDESDADLARDVRVLVRERLTRGDTDKQVVDYIVSRYGDFVLLKPPFKKSTYALWFGPWVFLGIGLIAAVSFYLRRRSGKDELAVAPLSEEERKRLDALLKEDGS